MTTLDLRPLLEQASRVLQQLEAWLPPVPPAIDWQALAFRWRRQGNTAWLESLHRLNHIAPADLLHLERQKAILQRNTHQFVQGKPANHVLMTGTRGTGKSSLVRAMLSEFHAQGLRLIEVDKDDLIDLHLISDCIAQRPERFIVFCDDLSFDEGEASYKALKSVLDGSIASSADNLLIYATSNRRHLMPEYHHETAGTHHNAQGELHPSEAVEEKISLSERFGLWLSFYPFSQDQYLAIVDHWLVAMHCPAEQIQASHTEALQWALQRGSRSGRVARHFALDWMSRLKPTDATPSDGTISDTSSANTSAP